MPSIPYHGGASTNDKYILTEFFYESTEYEEVSLSEIDRKHLSANSFKSLLSNDFLHKVMLDIETNYN